MHHTKLIDLSVRVKRATWRLNDQQHNSIVNDQFAANRLHALERDDYTCRGCNFMSLPTKTGSSFQEVHHLDDNHKNNDVNNLATMCPLCHQVFHIGAAGMTSGGTIVWLPEMTQAELNHLARSLFIAIYSNSEFSGSARALYASIESRAMYVEDVFAAGASDPAFFGQAFLDCDPNKIEPAVTHGLRLLAAPGRFKEAIDHWSAQSYAGVPPSSWSGLVIPASQFAEV